MIPRLTLVLLAGTLLVPDIQAQSPAKPRTDALGDPLPAGAIARLGTLRLKHTPASNATIDAALFSPDGAKIVSLVVGAGSIRLWNATSGKEINGPWSSANIRYTAVAFAPDGALLAAAINPGFRPNNIANDKTSRNTIILYDIARKAQVKTLSGPSQLVQAIGFADGGKTLVAGGDGTVRWWDVATGKEQRSWKPFADEQPKIEANGKKIKTFSYCSISPDAQAIAVQVDWRGDENRGFVQRYGEGNAPKEAIGYDLAQRKMYWHITGKGLPYEKSLFAFSADSKRIAIAIGTENVELRDAVTGKLLTNPLDSKLAGNSRLGGLALSSDGSALALASKDSNVQLWDIKEATSQAEHPQGGPQRREFSARIAQNGPGSTACLHFSPDNKRLLVGVDADLQVYDALTLREVEPSEGHRGWVEHLAFSPDGKRLLTGSAGRGQAGGDYFGPNGEVYFLVTGTSRGVPAPEQASWDVATWKRVQLTSVRTPPWPNFGSTSLDQSVYVGKTGDDRFGLYDMKSGQMLSRMLVSDKRLTPGVGFFSPRGKLYVQYASGNRGEITERLYAVPSGKLVCELPPVDQNRNRGAFLSITPGDPGNNLAFSHDERLVAQFGRGDGMIHVFDTVTGKLLHSLGKKLEFEEGRVDVYTYDVAFSKDGKFLVSWSSMDKLIRLWDVRAGTELIQIVPEAPRTNSPGILGGQRRINLAWSPDGRVLAVAENKIRLWEMTTLGVRRELAGHQDGPIRALAFAPDGQVLASASADTTVLIWDIAMADRPGPAEGALEGGALEKRWQALAEGDAAQAFAAMLDLAAAPKESVAWIGERVKPAGPIDPKRIEKLIDDLNDNQFKVRQNATAALLQMGDRVVPAIDTALAAKPALETHIRLQDVRKRLTGPVLKGEVLRSFRAVEVLERIGTPAARQVLQALADGATGALVTRQAHGALERLESE